MEDYGGIDERRGRSWAGLGVLLFIFGSLIMSAIAFALALWWLFVGQPWGD